MHLLRILYVSVFLALLPTFVTAQETDSLVNRLNTINAAKYLKAFDLFVLPSRSEAMALVILETGLAQIPVVASRVGGIPEAIPNETFGKLFDSEKNLTC